MKTDIERLNEDIEAVNLGNLNTVQFDLQLPYVGEHGTIISWESKDTRYIKRDGKVKRPRNGTGKRIVTLVGTFQYKDIVKQKEFSVTVLEENRPISIIHIQPIHIIAECNVPIELPNTAIVETNDHKTLTHTIDWKQHNPLIYSKPGVYTIHGVLLRSEVCVEASVEVVEHIEVEYLDKDKQVLDVSAYVTLQEGVFLDAQKELQNVLLKMNDDQMLYNFRMTCGLDLKGAPAMSGWDTPDSNLRGHTTGHYLSALAKCFKATKDEAIKAKARYMIKELKHCQNQFNKLPNFHEGYLAGFDESAYDALEEFAQYPKLWAPYYTMHKMMAGLLDCYEMIQIQEALDIVTHMGDWVYRRLSKCSKTQLKTMWGIYIAGEYGGINESLAKLYSYTKQKEHLLAAQMFDNDRLFIPMMQHVDALCYLHVNQHVPQILGSLEIFKGTNIKRYFDIAKNFWDIVTDHHIYANGGIGEGEIFHSPDAIASMIDDNTAETCASYNMLKLTRELFAYEPTVTYMDYYERTMINHILASRINGIPDGTTYFFPMEPGSKKSYLDENSCCHGTSLESHFQYMDAIFYKNEYEIYINLFISSKLEIEDCTMDMSVSMENPDKVSLRVMSKKPYALRIRIPYWANGHDVILDKENITYQVEDDYIILRDIVGDRSIELDFHCSYFLERTQDDKSIASLHYGPYVLCALHDNREYLTSRLDEERLPQQIKKDGLMFYDMVDLLKFIPLYKLNDQRYHTYFKIK